MAANDVGSKISLEIRTKSVEQTLIPLVTQITTLVNHKEKPIKSERTLQALAQVGHAVNVAVQRFVDIGESIAEENGDIRRDMCEACQEARASGASIQRLTTVSTGVDSASKKMAEKAEMVRVARQLLSALTKVLVLADRVVVKQLLAAKTKVLNDTHKLESTSSFGDFVKAFSVFGNNMVEFAHVTGDRQNDLKCEKSRARIGAARTVLERATMMLLVSSKTAMRHPDCDAAVANRAAVLVLVRRALQSIHSVVTDGDSVTNRSTSPASALNGDSGISLSAHHQTVLNRTTKDFQDMVEMVRMTKLTAGADTKLQACLESLLDTTLEFTDSAYTSHANRENILVLGDKLRSELTSLLRLGLRTPDQKQTMTPAAEVELAARLETAIQRLTEALTALKKELLATAMNQASELFKSNEDGDLLTSLRQCAALGAVDRVREISVKFDEHSEQIQELCRLLMHVASSEVLVVWTQHTENIVKSLSTMVVQSALTLALNSDSKIAKENLDVFADAWVQQVNELSTLVRDVGDSFHGNKTEKQLYLSLPRPGKHGTTVKSMKPGKLSSEEQSKMAKLGLEMKLITSEMEADVERWEDWDNELVRRARNMSSMAFSMYLFTRGEGQLRTTQDLFTQAEYFADEGTKLFRAIKDFAVLMPLGVSCHELLVELERLPALCHELNYALHTTTVGKAATFNKVDNVIQETKNLMNVVAKAVNTCFLLSKRYNIDYTGRPVRVPRWPADANGGGAASSDGSDRDSVKSGRSDALARSIPFSMTREAVSGGTSPYDLRL